MSSWPLPWLAATTVTLVVAAAVLAEWARQRPAVRAGVLAGGAGAALGGALVLLLVEPADVPTGWITVLQEGRSARNVRQLYGLGTHAGPGFDVLVAWLGGDGPATLPAVVRLNLGLAVADAIVFAFVARHVLGSWWASLALTAGWAGNLNTINAAFSETPAMLWTLLVWLACVVAAVVADRGASAGLRRLACAGLALLVLAAYGVRAEAVVLGLPALALGVAHLTGAEERLDRALRALGRGLRPVVTGSRAVFLLAAGVLLALEYVPVPEGWRWVFAAVRPLNLSFLTWLQAIMLLFPFAIVVLAVLGTIHGVRRWLAFFLLPISLLVLLRIYASASHGAFLDKFRYLAFVTPFVAFLALFGFRELTGWAERLAWPAWWQRVAVLALVATVPAWNPWQRELFGRRQELPGVATAAPFLARNQQTEVRYLLDLVGRHPRCVFLAKTPRADSAADPATGHRWLAFGAAASRLDEREVDAPIGVERVAAEMAPGAPCVLFYRSMDCDLVGFDGCAPETDGRRPLEERVLENLPYSESYEYGAHRAEIRLGVYPVVVRDPSALAGAGDAPH